MPHGSFLKAPLKQTLNLADTETKLDQTEKQLQAFKVVCKKLVNLWFLSHCNNARQYNRNRPANRRLTPKEFNSIKEHL